VTVLFTTFVLMTLLAQGSVAPAGPISTGTRLSGVVTEDGGRTPVAGARVMLMASRPSPGFADPNQPPMTVTDREGRFTFDGVAPGRYRLNAQKPGFATIGAPPEVAVIEGQPRAGVMLTLQRGGVIAGRVLDESGEPVINASVMAMRRPPALPAAVRQPPNVLMTAGSTQTNDLGEFRLFGLAPGEYAVQVNGRDMFGNSLARKTTPVPTYYPGTTDPLAAQIISLASGQTFGNVDITVIELPSFQVSGVVRDHNGRPVNNAQVRLTSAPSNAVLPMGPRMSNQARSDVSGRFTINAVTAGTYTLTAIPPVVVSRAAAAGTPAATGIQTFGLVSGVVGGSPGAAVMRETRDGATTEWRDDNATSVPVSIDAASVTGLEIVVTTP
jgi:protocatechuate 3,4-dioxygenase beta subunit